MMTFRNRTLTSDLWRNDVEVFAARFPELSRTVFAAVADTVPEEERSAYERVLDAALAGAGGDHDLAAGLLRHLFLEEPSVEAIHLRLEQTWLLILDCISDLLVAGACLRPQWSGQLPAS